MPKALGPGWASAVRGIQRTNALQGPAPIGPTNHNYGDVNTGDIHVHTRATEPQAVGGAVSEAVKRLVVQANTAFDH